jgi:molecular chaperone GrpE
MDDVSNIDEKEEEVEEKADSVEEEAEPKEEKNSKKTKQKKEGEVEELKRKVTELEEQLLRSVADYRNLEKRVDEEKREFVKFANRDLLLRLIPAFDTLFLAEKYVADEGIKLTIKHLQESFKEVGVERVETSGKEFDAQIMEAIATGEGEEGKVLEELRPGFTLNGKLVRPAQVKVGSGSSN